MSNDFAVDPHPAEGDLPEAWREHVRELRGENARRRKENQELRAQLASLSENARASEDAQAAASKRAERDAKRHKAVHRRLKELELRRNARQALEESVARRGEGSGAVDAARAQRLLERVPSPVDLDTEVLVDDEGHVTLEPAAGERLRGFVEELVELLTVERSVAPPPVGGEPPRPASPGHGSAPNSWDPEGQTSPAAKARATLRKAAARQGVVLDGLTQL